MTCAVETVEARPVGVLPGRGQRACQAAGRASDLQPSIGRGRSRRREPSRVGFDSVPERVTSPARKNHMCKLWALMSMQFSSETPKTSSGGVREFCLLSASPAWFSPMSSGDDSSRSHALLLLDVSRKGAAEAHERCAQYDGYGHGGHAAVGAWPAGLRVESDACADNKECEDQVALPCSPDRNDSEDEELSCLLACFDLSMRFSRIPPYRWAQEAKEKAAEIRHGECPSIVWWTSAGRSTSIACAPCRCRRPRACSSSG